MIAAFKGLRNIHRVFDEAAVVLEEDIGKPICLSGCGRCCERQVPHWTYLEAMLATSILTGTGKLTQALSVAEGWLLERHRQAMIYEGMPIGWASPRLRDEFNALSLSTPCPFLAEDKRCLIYEVRPLTCRANGVTRDNVDLCPRQPGRGETLTQRRYIPASVLRSMVDEWRKSCHDSNATWLTSGLVPTVLYRAAKELRFRELVRDNRIASAKLVGMEIDTALMWQPQVAAIREGIEPELALLRR